MWSVGVILFQMLYGTSPWPKVRTIDQLMQAHQRPIAYPPSPAVSPACAEVLRHLLQRDVHLRATPPEFFDSRFLKGFVTVQVRHVTTLRRAVACPSTELDVPDRPDCRVNDVAQLLEAKLGVALENLLIVAGPPQRRLAGSVEDPMEWIDLDSAVEVKIDDDESE